MSVKEKILFKINDTFTVTFLEVLNESHKHSVPENSETHFKVLLISPDFTNCSRVARQRQLNELLKEELAGPIHALSMRLLTPEEAENSVEFKSPKCHGGTGK